ncbi:conjugal transfer protein TrbC [Burkholderia vietnamiensis]|nr:TrbC/VirB2 family protein [Burkholderia vietnamiensis]MBR7917076.1 conjugal transfer protein TrbC [Burkholderia vietnamiensis]
MQKQQHALFNRLRMTAVATSRALFARNELHSTLIAAALAGAAPAAHAVDMSSLGAATDVICLISSYISGPWLYGIGIVLIIIGAVAIANSESNIGKMISSVLVGLGIAACALPIVRDHLHVNYTCA